MVDQNRRPLALGETLDAAMNLGLRNYRAMLLIVAAVALPFALIEAVIMSMTTEAYEIGSAAISFDTDSSGTVVTSDGAFFAGQVAVVVMQAFVFALSIAACVRLVVGAYLGRPKGSPREALGDLAPVLWTALMMVALIAASLVTIIGPVWLGVAWAFASVIVVAERASGWTALRRSYRLVEHRWWATFARLFVGGLIIVIGNGVVTLLAALPFESIDPQSTWAPVVATLVTTVGVVVTTPFMIALVVVVYADLRIRKEPSSLDGVALGEGGAADHEPPRFQPPAGSPSPEEFGGFAPPLPPGRPSPD